MMMSLEWKEKVAERKAQRASAVQWVTNEPCERVITSSNLAWSLSFANISTSS